MQSTTLTHSTMDSYAGPDIAPFDPEDSGEQFDDSEFRPATEVHNNTISGVIILYPPPRCSPAETWTSYSSTARRAAPSVTWPGTPVSL